MTKPHKWAKEIHAWAEGAEIQMRMKEKNLTWSDWFSFSGVWHDYDWHEYRIKPQPKEPQYLYVYADFRGDLQITDNTEYANSHKVFGKIKLEVDDAD